MMQLQFSRRLILYSLAMVLGACSRVAIAPINEVAQSPVPVYQIGPGDSGSLFVWRSPELSRGITVRPDGRVSIPLVGEVVAAGKTPEALGKEIEEALGQYVREPIVTVVVTSFAGVSAQQIRVVGEATRPLSIPYRANLTLLDVMIEVGGVTEFAAGNRATLVRERAGRQNQYRVRLDDLLKSGDISANTSLLPGDIIIIPQKFL